MKKAVLGLATAGALMGTVSALPAGAARGACPASANPLTINQAIALPRTQAGIQEGLATEQDVRASYEEIDTNGNGILCVKLPPGWEGEHTPWAFYYYQFSDDRP